MSDMMINNFSIISFDAHPEKSEYCLEKINIDGTIVMVQCEVIERLNTQIENAVVFVAINKKWISAVYIKSFNPNIDVEYNAFMDDLRKFVKYLKSNYMK